MKANAFSSVLKEDILDETDHYVNIHNMWVMAIYVDAMCHSTSFLLMFFCFLFQN